MYSEIKTVKERKLVFSMMLSSILPLLDSSVINVILPKISDDIGTSYAHIQWAVTAYMLSCSAGILLSPFINKKYGVRITWFCSILIFLIGSVLVGFSIDIISLIIFRCIQGIGAGILIPVTQSVMAIQFGKERLKSVMALIAIPAVFAPAVGPILGAVLSDGMNWRVAFFINIPVILIAIIWGGKVIPQTDREDEEINFPVFLMFFISLVLIFISTEYFYSRGRAGNYNVEVLLVGFLLLIASIVLNNKSKHKVINLSQLKKPKYSLAIVMGFFTSLVFFGFLIFFPLLRAEMGDVSTIYLGFLLALQGAGAWIARKLIYQKCYHYSPFLIIGSGIIVSAASILIIRNGGVGESIGFIVRGAGLGIATISTLSAPFEFGEKEYVYDTSAITRVIQQIGGAFGGLLSGYLIYLVVDKSITVYSAYQIFFSLSLFIGVFSIIVFFLEKKSE